VRAYIASFSNPDHLSLAAQIGVDEAAPGVGVLNTDCGSNASREGGGRGGSAVTKAIADGASNSA